MVLTRTEAEYIVIPEKKTMKFNNIKPRRSNNDLNYSTKVKHQIKFKVGDCFSSYEEFKVQLDDYCKQENQCFVIRDNTKCNPNCKFETCKLKQGLVYHDLVLECKHGQRRHKSIQHINKKRSLKVNCPAKIRLNASKNGKFLVITKIELEHKGHLDTQTDPVPEMRRLDLNEKADVLQLLKLKCGRPQILGYIKDKYNKQLYSYDIKNLAASLRQKTSDDLKNSIEFLKDKGARIDILQEGDVFQGIFFTTPDMIQSLKAWPEVVSFDGTYKLMLHGLIFILFVIHDGNYLTEDVAIAIVRREDQPSYDWVFRCFRKHHEDSAENIKYFMCDKNAAQRNSVVKYFPNSSLLVCWWHTKEIFEREIKKLKIATEQKQKCLELLMKFSDVDTLDEYNDLLAEMKKEFPDQALCYFMKNWDPIKTQWTCFSENTGTFGSKTNNRCESINQKLKTHIQLLSTLSTAIKDFFTWRHFHQNENKKKIIRNYGSEVPSCNNQYNQLLLDQVLKLVLEELKNIICVTFDREDSGTFFINRTKRVTTAETCNCYFNRSYQLPCRHIFLARKQLDLPDYNPQLCHTRWRKEFMVQNHRVFINNCIVYESQAPTVTEKEYNLGDLNYQMVKLVEVCSDIIDLVSIECGTEFDQKFYILSEMRKCWSDEQLFQLKIKSILHLSGNENTNSITGDLKDLTLSGKTNNEHMDVPQKRQKISKIFETLYTECDNVKKIENKVEMLNFLREAWLENKIMYIEHVTGEEQVASKKLKAKTNLVGNGSLVLPKTGKMKGRPKNAFATTKSYKKKK